MYRPGLVLDTVLHDGVEADSGGPIGGEDGAEVQRGDRLLVLVRDGSAEVYNATPRQEESRKRSLIRERVESWWCARCRAALLAAQRKSSFAFECRGAWASGHVLAARPRGRAQVMVPWARRPGACSMRSASLS